MQLRALAFVVVAALIASSGSAQEAESSATVTEETQDEAIEGESGADVDAEVGDQAEAAEGDQTDEAEPAQVDPVDPAQSDPVDPEQADAVEAGQADEAEPGLAPDSESGFSTEEAAALEDEVLLMYGETTGRDVRGGEAGGIGLRLSEYGVEVGLHGYMSAEAKAVLPGGTPTFDLHHSVLMINASMFDRVGTEFALEWAHIGNEFYIPFAFADIKLWPWMLVRAGYFPVPIGAFNEYLYPDFLRLTGQQPLLTRHIIPGVWSEVGVQLRGKFDIAGNLRGNYAVYVVNGLEQHDDDFDDDLVPDGGGIRDMRFHARDEAHPDKGFGGRIGLSHYGLNVGVSGYTGAYTSDGQQRLSMVDVDLTWRYGNFQTRLEAIAALQETSGADLTKYGLYGLVGYRLARYVEPYLMLELVDHEAGNQMLRGVGGMAFYFFPEVAPGNMIKLEVVATRDGAGDTEYLPFLQLCAAF